MAVPQVIAKAPATIRPADAERIAKLVDEAYQSETGKPNVYTKHRGKATIPVVCVSLGGGGLSSYWMLDCNDPELSEVILRNIVISVRDALSQ